MGLDRRYLCFERKQLNGNFYSTKRVIESLPSKVEMNSFNIYELYLRKEVKAKAIYLESCGIKNLKAN